MTPIPVTPQDASRRTREICSLARVIPEIEIEDAITARPLAEALVSGGLPALEVTPPTPAALDAIRAMSDGPGGHVGAGTLITSQDIRNAGAAGATFTFAVFSCDRCFDSSVV